MRSLRNAAANSVVKFLRRQDLNLSATPATHPGFRAYRSFNSILAAAALAAARRWDCKSIDNKSPLNQIAVRRAPLTLVEQSVGCCHAVVWRQPEVVICSQRQPAPAWQECTCLACGHRCSMYW